MLRRRLPGQRLPECERIVKACQGPFDWLQTGVDNLPVLVCGDLPTRMFREAWHLRCVDHLKQQLWFMVYSEDHAWMPCACGTQNTGLSVCGSLLAQ